MVTVKSLGVVLDKRLCFDDKHVNDVCKFCYWHITAFRPVMLGLGLKAKFSGLGLGM